MGKQTAKNTDGTHRKGRKQQSHASPLIDGSSALAARYDEAEEQEAKSQTRGKKTKSATTSPGGGGVTRSRSKANRHLTPVAIQKESLATKNDANSPRTNAKDVMPVQASRELAFSFERMPMQTNVSTSMKHLPLTTRMRQIFGRSKSAWTLQTARTRIAVLTAILVGSVLLVIGPSEWHPENRDINSSDNSLETKPALPEFAPAKATAVTRPQVVTKAVPMVKPSIKAAAKSPKIGSNAKKNALNPAAAKVAKKNTIAPKKAAAVKAKPKQKESMKAKIPVKAKRSLAAKTVN